MRVFIEGPVNNAVNLKTTTNNRAEKHIDDKTHIAPTSNDKVESNKADSHTEQNEIYLTRNDDVNDDSFYENDDKNTQASCETKEITLKDDDTINQLNKLNINDSDRKENQVSAACFVM